MCQVTAGRAASRPRWGWLYAACLVPLTALAAVETVAPPTGLRTVLRSFLAVATLAALVLWIRLNRMAFDLQNWCDCAASTITIRVVESRRPPDRDTSRPDAWPDSPGRRRLASPRAVVTIREPRVKIP